MTTISSPNIFNLSWKFLFFRHWSLYFKSKRTHRYDFARKISSLPIKCTCHRVFIKLLSPSSYSVAWRRAGRQFQCLCRSSPSSLHRLLSSSSSSPRRSGHRDWSSPGRRIFSQLDELRTEVQRRDQELLAMSAKMKTLEEQHQDYQRHIAVLKESLCAKEEHYNMLQADVSISLIFLIFTLTNKIAKLYFWILSIKEKIISNCKIDFKRYTYKK